MTFKVAEAGHVLQRYQQVHLIGIGGVGMSALAWMFLAQGIRVTGSDVALNRYTAALSRAGATIWKKHDVRHVQSAQAVIYSSAISEDNVERQAAAQNPSVDLWHRGDLLAALMADSFGIAVSGTHGKTTTSALLTYILQYAKREPSYALGGRIVNQSFHGHIGKSTYFVAEADESDASFLKLQPMMAILTNIDADHLDHYDHQLNQLQGAFCQFLKRLPYYGCAVLNHDDPLLAQWLKTLSRPVVTYGFHSKADYQVIELGVDGLKQQFKVTRPNQRPLCLDTHLLGRHNVHNILAAVTAASTLGVDSDLIEKAVTNFPGVENRAQYHQLPQGTPVVDDYGHHPHAMKMIFDCTKMYWPTHRKIIIFQPHRYTRTAQFMTEFVQMLCQYDAVWLLPLYAASEPAQPAVSADVLAERCRQAGTTVYSVDSLAAIEQHCLSSLSAHDVLVLQGAGPMIAQLATIIHERAAVV